jgi:hypothetical protein
MRPTVGVSWYVRCYSGDVLVTRLIEWASSLCPNCSVGQEARRGFLGPEWGYHLTGVALPFALVLVICLWLVRRPPPERT